MKTRYKAILIHLLLRAYGWRKCKLQDGSDGWSKPMYGRSSIRKGHTLYALAHIDTL